MPVKGMSSGRYSLAEWKKSVEAMVQKVGGFNGTGTKDCVIKCVEPVTEKK